MERVARELRKVKLNSNGGLTVEWTDTFFNEATNQKVTVNDSKTSDAVAHQDFHREFSRLREHLMFGGEWVGKPKTRPLFDGTTKNVERFRIGSVTFSGGNEVVKKKGDTEEKVKKPVAVHLSGSRRLESKLVVNFTLPGIKLDHAQEPYEYAAELHAHVEAVELETWAYLEGKVQPPPQLGLDFQGQEGE